MKIKTEELKLSSAVESAELNKRLKATGLLWDGHLKGKASSFKPKPTLAGDKMRNISTIEAIRAERDL
jgi:hypothetical protein